MKENYPINIVEEIWMYLSPFSAHQIEIWGEKFATVEHAYQSAKFLPGKIRDEVKNSLSPYACWKLSTKYKELKDQLALGFDKDKIMEELMRTKLSQHDDVLQILKMTGNKGILKIHSEDYYWATGADGSGQNKMGKLWMKIRDEIK